MSNLGLGVMINMLGGNRDSVEAFTGAVGKIIVGIKLCPSAAFMFHQSDAIAFEWLETRAYAPKDAA